MSLAQKIDGECSCSPRQFRFKLNLSATCPASPPPMPPNDDFNGGVKDYVCTIGPEPIPQTPQEMTSEDTADLVLPEDVDEPTRRRGSGVGTYKETVTDYFPELDKDSVGKDHKTTAQDFQYQLELSSANISTSSVVISDMDVEPVSIYSIQFLEVDTEFKIINQDSAYVTGIDFKSGDVFNYTSISAQDANVIPGGMNMILRGVNAANEPVKNVFTITYTNDCGIQTFEEGDAIGWVVFENSEPASEETCGAPSPTTPQPSPSTTPSPTRKPSSDGTPTTPSPTRKDSTPRPSKKPTQKPSMSMSPLPPDYIMGKSFKSGGNSKSSKSKSSKSSKSKSSKSYGKSTDGGSYHAPHPKVAKRRRTGGHHEPIRGRDLRAQVAAARDGAFFTDTLIEEIKLDRYFLLDNKNDRKLDDEENNGVVKGDDRQKQRHLRR